MHETEISDGNYSFGLLVNLNIEIEVGPSLNEIFTYVSKHGILRDTMGSIPVAEVRSKNRRRHGFSQLEVQKFTRDKISPDLKIDHFIQTSIDDPNIRLRRTERLKEFSEHFMPKSFEEISI